MSSVSDYRERTADLAAFQGVFRRGAEELLVQELVTGSNGGALVAGVQKLAQKVLLVLLTEKGSKPYRLDDGTDFVTAARRGRWRTVADVEQSFYAARVDVRRQVQASETDADPDDERYGSMELLGVTLATGKASIRVELRSRAGDTYTFLTPITVPLR